MGELQWMRQIPWPLQPQWRAGKICYSQLSVSLVTYSLSFSISCFQSYLYPHPNVVTGSILYCYSWWMWRLTSKRAPYSALSVLHLEQLPFGVNYAQWTCLIDRARDGNDAKKAVTHILGFFFFMWAHLQGCGILHWSHRKDYQTPWDARSLDPAHNEP